MQALPLPTRGLGRGELGSGDRALDRADHRVVERHARRVHGGPGHLGAREHVGQDVLHRLERADRLVELHALVRIGHREVRCRLRVAEQLTGDQGSALQAKPSYTFGIQDPVALRERTGEPTHGCERIQW